MTRHTQFGIQFEIVYGPDRKHTISSCFSEAKKQKSRPSLWTCPSLFSGIKRDNNDNRPKPKSRPTYSFDNRNSVNRPKHEILLWKDVKCSNEPHSLCSLEVYFHFFLVQSYLENCCLLWINKVKGKDKMYMSVGVMKDYKLKRRKLRDSYSLGCPWNWNT